MIMKRNTLIKLLGVFSVVLIGSSSCQYLNNQSKSDRDNSKTSIGAILPLTGSFAYLGQGEKVGMELASENNPHVSLVFEDSQGKADLALSAMKKLLDFQKINIHVVSTTGAVLSTLPAYKESGKDVLVFAQATIPDVTNNYPFAYRLYVSADKEADLLAKYAKQKKYMRIGALHFRYRAGEDAVRIFKSKVNSYGGKVIHVENFTADDKDLRPILKKFKDSKLDAIIVYGFATNFPLISKQMSEVGLNLPVLANSALATGEVDRQLTVGFKNSVIFPAPYYYTAKNDPQIQAFNRKVEAKGQKPSFDIAYFYDMTNILIQSIEGTSEKSPRIIGSKIISTKKYKGVTGNIEFNQNRDAVVDVQLVKFINNTIQKID
jgi:branched-chain amino acid transport system substrate-binding protein